MTCAARRGGRVFSQGNCAAGAAHCDFPRKRTGKKRAFTIETWRTFYNRKRLRLAVELERGRVWEGVVK